MTGPDPDSGSEAGSVAYLGPPGTFTEQALEGVDELNLAQRVPLPSMSDVLFAVAEGEVDHGIVAIENAIEGTVNVTVDTLAFDVDLRIQREIVMRIRMDLMARPGVALDEIDRVISIPVASAQCRSWLRQNLPDAASTIAPSTAEAAAIVASGSDRGIAAIANSRCAEVYGLDTLAADIEDHSGNVTRFVTVGRHGIPAPTGHDKTSLVVFQHADQPGSLLAILQEFAARQINLTLLLSRPTKAALGDYCFIVDIEGHISDEVVADCLRRLKATQADVKFLGSYPAAGAAAAKLRGAAGEADRAAGDWIRDLRSQVAPS